MLGTHSLVVAQKTIQFAGQTWNVRSGTGNPGANNWSDAPESVWVDDQGRLHLKIRKENGIWYCSEVISQQSFGYGEYIFYLGSNVEEYDPNVVAAMFTYENDNREIDIEFTGSGFGNSSYTDTPGWYTVQPKPYTSANQKRFKLNLTDNFSTHKFNWSKSSIQFQSYHGNYPYLPSAGFLIQEWTYAGSKNPPAGKERLHLNLYLIGGKPPTDGKDVEFIINAVYIPISSVQVNLFPDVAVDGGAKWRLDGGEWQNSGAILSKVANCPHQLSFSKVPGWFSPADTVIKPSGASLLQITDSYQINTAINSVDESGIRIFPNPTIGELKIESPEYLIDEVKITDIMGRLLYVENINANYYQKTTSDWQSGFYFIHAKLLNGNTIQKKILKISQE